MSRPLLEGELDHYVGTRGPEFAELVRRERVASWAFLLEWESQHRVQCESALGNGRSHDSAWLNLRDDRAMRLREGGALHGNTFDRLTEGYPEARALYTSDAWNALEPRRDLVRCQSLSKGFTMAIGAPRSACAMLTTIRKGSAYCLL